MQYFHTFKVLCFLSCWTLLCWIFFVGEKNIFNQVKSCADHKKWIAHSLFSFFFQVQVISDAILSEQKELVLRERMVLNIDRSGRLNETSLVRLIQPFMPNVPLQLWEENKEKLWFSKTSCGRWCIRIKKSLFLKILHKKQDIFWTSVLSLNFGTTTSIKQW